MRLIDAEAIEKILVDFATKTFRKFCVSEDAIAESLVIVGVTMDLKEIISKAPTVEMRPKGRWIEECETVGGHYHLMLSCSACGWTTDRLTTRENYCPNCGADMRGGD